MTGPINIERVEENNLGELTALLHATKLALSINRLIIQDWPNDPAQEKLYRGAVEGALHSEGIEDWKATDESAGKIIGYLAQTVQDPKFKDKNDSENSQSQVPEGVVPEVYEAVMQATNTITDATRNVRRIEIVYTCVEKSYRRQGIGSRLLEKCFMKAEELGLPVIVYAEPAARAFYEHKGFKEFAHADTDLGEFAVPFSGFGAFRLTGMIWHQGGT